MAAEVTWMNDFIRIGSEKIRWQKAKKITSSVTDEFLAKLLLDLYFSRLTPSEGYDDWVEEGKLVKIEVKEEEEEKGDCGIASTESDEKNASFVNPELKVDLMRMLPIESVAPSPTCLGVPSTMELESRADSIRDPRPNVEENRGNDDGCFEHPVSRKPKRPLKREKTNEERKMATKRRKSCENIVNDESGKAKKNETSSRKRRRRRDDLEDDTTENTLRDEERSERECGDEEGRNERSDPDSIHDPSREKGESLGDGEKEAGGPIEGSDDEERRECVVMERKSSGVGLNSKRRLQSRIEEKDKPTEQRSPSNKSLRQKRQMNQCMEYFEKLDGSEMVACNVCKMRVKASNHSLTLHLKHNHGLVRKENSFQPLTCERAGCDKTIVFATAVEFRRHMNSVHVGSGNTSGAKARETTNDSGVCFLCGLSFLNLKQHVENVHTNRETVVCTHPGCGRRVLKRHLKSHMRCHTPGVCPFPDCNMKFPTKNSVFSHVRSVHNTYLQEKLQCPHCPQIYNKPVYLKRHVKEMHLLGKIYHCPAPTCDKSFRQEHTRDQHARIHFNIKPFQCMWCDFTGVQQNNIRSHAMTTHRKEFHNAKQSQERYWRPTRTASLDGSDVSEPVLKPSHDVLRKATSHLTKV